MAINLIIPWHTDISCAVSNELNKLFFGFILFREANIGNRWKKSMLLPYRISFFPSIGISSSSIWKNFPLITYFVVICPFIVILSYLRWKTQRNSLLIKI